MTPLEFHAWWQDHQESLHDYLKSALCVPNLPTLTSNESPDCDYTTAPEMRMWLWSQHEELITEFGLEQFHYALLKNFVKKRLDMKPGDNIMQGASKTRCGSFRWETILGNSIRNTPPAQSQFTYIRRYWYRINPQFVKP